MCIYIAVKCLALMSTSRHRQSVKKGSGIYEQMKNLVEGTQVIMRCRLEHHQQQYDDVSVALILYMYM